jgi:hypothetical protein
VGGVLTGRGAEALSETQRKNVNDWYDHSLVSRLNDKRTGCIILIMQRLHEDDLVGHVLPQGDWKVLRFPAIGERHESHTVRTRYSQWTFVRREGEALHPERESLEVLARMREVLGEYHLSVACISSTLRLGSATAIVATTVLVIEKKEMIRVLHVEHAFSDRFISYMLSRNIRVEEDLVDQLFNSSEKRLARTLLLLARYGKEEKPQKLLPKISQEMLAEMVGTTRSRVNFFMNKFRKLGFIKYDGGLHIDTSLLSVVLHE